MSKESAAAITAQPVTSFQRRGKARPPSVLGTKPSTHNLQLLASSGVPSMVSNNRLTKKVALLQVMYYTI